MVLTHSARAIAGSSGSAPWAIRGAGLRLGANGIVADCTAQGNTLDGIEAGAGCALRDCTASGNLGTAANSRGHWERAEQLRRLQQRNRIRHFRHRDGSTLTNCAAHSNNGSGTTSYGIDAGSGSTVIGCSANDNTNDNAAPTNSAIGINGIFGTLIKGCSARTNDGHGIVVSSDCRVLQNNCDSNGLSGTSLRGLLRPLSALCPRIA